MGLRKMRALRFPWHFPSLSSRWGSVFTLWLGLHPAVVLCGYAALQNALVLQAEGISHCGATAVFERFTHRNGEAQGGWK